MKKGIVSVVVVAIAVMFVTTLFAAETAKTSPTPAPAAKAEPVKLSPEKTKTTTTPAGTELTKTKGTVKTDVAGQPVEGKYKSTEMTTETPTGTQTVTKGKATIVEGPAGAETKFKVKFLRWNENDPTKDSDNTMTVLTTKGEKEVGAHKNIKENTLKKLVNKDVIISTYEPTLETLAKDKMITKIEEAQPEAK